MKFLIQFFLLVCFSIPSLGKAVTYLVDKAHSSVNFSVTHLGVVPVNGSFQNFEGSLQYDPKTKKITNIKFKIDVTSINTNEPDRDTHLRGPDFFGVHDKFANVIKKRRYITFHSKGAKVPTKTLRGKLKILDTEKVVTFKGQIKAVDNMIGGTLKLAINRHKYGLNWQKPGTNLLKKAAGKSVGDIVKITVNILTKQKKEKKK